MLVVILFKILAKLHIFLENEQDIAIFFITNSNYNYFGAYNLQAEKAFALV